MVRQACRTVVWSRPPKASPISGRLCGVSSRGQPHGDLARSGDGAGALLRIHLGDLDLVVVGDVLLDQFQGDLAVVGADDVLEGFLGAFDGDVAAVEAGKGDDSVEGAFEFAHVGAQVLGDQEGDVVAERDCRSLRPSS